MPFFASFDKIGGGDGDDNKKRQDCVYGNKGTAVLGKNKYLLEMWK